MGFNLTILNPNMPSINFIVLNLTFGFWSISHNDPIFIDLYVVLHSLSVSALEGIFPALVLLYR